MPGAVLITKALLPMLTLGAEWRHIDLRGMSCALARSTFTLRTRIRREIGSERPLAPDSYAKCLAPIGRRDMFGLG
jgi:hypothetical protein